MRLTAWQRIGALVLASQVLIALLPYAAPYRPDEQHRRYPLAPPTVLHLSVADGVYVCALAPDIEFASYREDCGVKHSLQWFEGGTADGMRLLRVHQPGVVFLLGTDELGRDVASRFLVGARQSLFAAEAATLLALAIAVVIGTIGGYRGGFADRVFLRAGDVMMALPWLYALLALRGALPLAVAPETMTRVTVLLLALIGWVRPARVFRALVASTSSAGYVRAAIGFGAPPAAVMRRHLAPVVAGAALTQAALLVPQFLLAEVALSVLGVLGDSAGGWGPLLALLQRYALVSSAWWLALPAILAIAFLMLCQKLADASQQTLRGAVRGSL